MIRFGRPFGLSSTNRYVIEKYFIVIYSCICCHSFVLFISCSLGELSRDWWQPQSSTTACFCTSTDRAMDKRFAPSYCSHPTVICCSMKRNTMDIIAISYLDFNPRFVESPRPSQLHPTRVSENRISDLPTENNAHSMAPHKQRPMSCLLWLIGR